MKKLILTILIIIQCSLLGATIINVPSDYYTIQAAVDAAADGDTILVQPGMYIGNITIESKGLTVGSLFLTTGDSSYIEQTIMNGNQNGSCCFIKNNDKDRFHFTTICGFKMINGTGSYEEEVNSICGGGIYAKDAKLIIKSSIIQDNIARRGGGIYTFGTEIYVENTIIRYNEGNLGYFSLGGGMCCEEYSIIKLKGCDISENTQEYAGGISFWRSDFIIEDCTINNNKAFGGGGGMSVECSNQGIIRNSEISSNRTVSVGGGIYAYDSNLEFSNVLVANNMASRGGGVFIGAWIGALSTRFTNCTIANNVAAEEGYYGGGLQVGNSHTVYADITNCIFYDNAPRQIEQGYCDILIQYSDIEGGEADIVRGEGTITWGDGNIEDDPLFVDVDSFPYELSSSSPCINAGTPDTTGLYLPLTDLAGNQRVLYGRVDMGAYECENVSVDPGVSIVEGVSLYQNSPNPFRNGTEILFTVKDFSHINDYSVSIYNTKGQIVRTFAGKSNTEMTKIAWDGTDRFGKQISPGVYLYKLEYGDHAVVRKMVKLH